MQNGVNSQSVVETVSSPDLLQTHISSKTVTLQSCGINAASVLNVLPNSNNCVTTIPPVVASSPSVNLQIVGDKSFAKLSHHMTEMKKELEVCTKNRRDSNIEVQRLREKCQQLEDRVALEKSKCATLEERLEKSQLRQRNMLIQIESLQHTLSELGIPSSLVNSSANCPGIPVPISVPSQSELSVSKYQQQS